MADPDLSRDAPPRSWSRRAVTLRSGASLRYDSNAWRDEIIIIQQGTLELQDTAGRQWPFETGSVLSLCGLPLRRLTNTGPDDAVIIAIKPHSD
jgi:hypothetical protein